MSGEVVRCPICGSEMCVSVSIRPARLICGRRSCDGQVEIRVTEWPDGPSLDEVLRALQITGTNFIPEMYLDQIRSADKEGRFLLAKLGQLLVQHRDPYFIGMMARNLGVC
jgi:hypothetical protein